jgi:hypothetical protein
MMKKYFKKKWTTAEKQKSLNLCKALQTILTKFRVSPSCTLIAIELMRMPTRGIGNRENFSQ